MTNRNFAKDILIGLSIGDALGVPYEFKSRSDMIKDPATTMIGYGTHRQSPGTWSDDSSLTFCLAEMLCEKYDLQNLANRFINWKKFAYWTAQDYVFDMGITTSSAIYRLESGVSPVLAGDADVSCNGNGSLMRILPLLFYIAPTDIDKRLQVIKEVSSLTHRHIRSVLCCFIYLEFGLEILTGNNRIDAYAKTCNTVNQFLRETVTCSEEEKQHFSRILEGHIGELKEDEVHTSGYVIHTLEASLWCLLLTDNYKDAVIKAVNLGSDTDTTAAVTGGLAGLIYGYNEIPKEWLAILARRNDIEDLSNRLNAKYYK